jgi:hypothetical protein
MLSWRCVGRSCVHSPTENCATPKRPTARAERAPHCLIIRSARVIVVFEGE